MNSPPDDGELVPVLPSVTSVTGPQPQSAAHEPGPADFPTGCLPPDMAAMVKAVSLTARVPESLPACCALAAVSACVGRGLAITSASHRTARANVYIAVGARIGAGKSDCFGPVTAPVFEFQHRLIENWKAHTRPALLAEKRVVEARIRHVEEKVKTEQEADELQVLTQDLTSLMAMKESAEARLAEPLLVVEDITTERLAVLLSQNHETLFSASSDAGAVLNNLLGRYSRLGRTDEALYVKCYTGDRYRVDRIGRKSVALTQPCLTALWLVQPDKIDIMLGERGLSDGGLLSRIMVCQADAEPVKIDRTVGFLSPDVTGRWKGLLCALLENYHQRRSEPHILTPDDEAIRLLDEHQHGIVDRQRGELADADAFATRWNEWAWRLSVVLHAARHGSDAHDHLVTPDVAHVAIRLANWFADQQLDLLEMSRAASKEKKAEALLDLLRQRSKETWPKNAVNAREVQRARIAASSDEANALLNEMEAEGSLVSEDYHPPGGGHTVRYYRKAPRNG